MKLYATPQEIYDSCMRSESHIKVIAMPLFNSYGEILGFYKYYVD